MRVLAITTLCLARLLYSAETAGDGEAVPDEIELSIPDKIRSIAIDMWKLCDSLRDDRHDKVVQIQGEAIRKAIQKLIDDAEDADKKQQNKADGNDKGLNDSKDTGYSGGGRVKPSLRIWQPERFRDSHVDLAKPIVGAQDTPQGVWAARVSAYFYSLAVEEAEAEIKCRTTPKKKK